MASRICGCGSGAAAGGWLDSARLATAGAAFPFGAAGLPTVNTNANTKMLAISKLMLLVFTDHSSSRNLAEPPSSAVLNLCCMLDFARTESTPRVPGKAQGSESISAPMQEAESGCGDLLRVGSEEGDELERIGARAVYGGAPVEVRAGDAARGADFAEESAGVDKVAGLDRNGFEVGVEGVEAEAVVEDHGIAGEIERLGEHDAAALRGIDGSAGGGGKIDSAVGRAGFAVEDAALAEVAASSNAAERVVEAAVPETIGGDGGENGAEALALGFGAGELFRIVLDEIGRDFEAFSGELAFFYVDRCRARDFFGGFSFCGERERVSFRF